MSHPPGHDAATRALAFGGAAASAEGGVASELANAERDQIWLERIRSGDAVAFEAMFHTYAPRLCLTVSRYVALADVAEDLVQEVFLRIWRSRETWQVTAGIESYLLLAARNQAINWVRHARVVHRFESKQTSGDDETGASSRDVLAHLARAEDAAAVERALAALPTKQRQVCELRWRDQLSYQEIGARLGISVRTVENQIGRAIRRIRSEIGDR